VETIIAARATATIFLMVYAAIIILVVGIGLGLIGGGVRQARPAVAGLTAFGVAVPTFVAAMVLVAIFALKLDWFPTIGAGTGFTDRLRHLTLPAVALSIGASAYVAQITSAAIREEGGREHVETARGRGLPPFRVFRRHVVRNAAIPVVTVAALTIAGLIAGAVVVEVAFGIGGLGSLLVESVSGKDLPVVEAVSLLLIVVFVVATAFIDALQWLLDPRLRARGGAR
jgi:peptide/nickel transport system permease protein